MTNRAQITKPYTVDMFTTLPQDNLVTFTDHNAPKGYYLVTPDYYGAELQIHINEFDKHFKYYIQSTIF